MFDKVTAETRRLQGTTHGNTEVIRGLQRIENKNEFFAKLARVNKQMNQNKLRVSLAPDGKPLINNQFKVTVSELQSLGNEGRNRLFASYGPANVTTKNVPTRIYPSNTSAGTSSANPLKDITSYFILSEEIIKITNFLIRLSQAEKDYIYTLLSEISERLHDAFLLFCSELLTSLLPSELQFLGPDAISHIVSFLFTYIKKLIASKGKESDAACEKVFNELIYQGKIKPETFKMLKTRLMNWLAEIKSGKVNSLDPEMYDQIHKFRSCSKVFMTLEAGEVIDIGIHRVLIKASTIDMLEGWLDGYSQEYCDIFIEFCIKVVSKLSNQEAKRLNLVNPDEDLILRVADFVFTWHDVQLELIRFEEEGISMAFAEDMKNDLVNYWNNQKLRKHEVCNLCKGDRYLSK